MEVIGLGNEIVECLRIGRMIERHGEQFLLRVYTEREIRFCQESRNTTEQFAARWAAKEAVFKSLGVRPRGGLARTDVEIRGEADGRVKVCLSGATREWSDHHRVGGFMLSMAHCRGYATATCLALG